MRARGSAEYSIDGYMCPVCHHGAAEPFSCGGPHPNIRKDGTPGKRRVYQFIEAQPVRFIERTP